MAFLIDADVIIQAERKGLDFDAWLRSHPDDEIKLAAITAAELWRSVARATGIHRVARQRLPPGSRWRRRPARGLFRCRRNRTRR